MVSFKRISNFPITPSQLVMFDTFEITQDFAGVFVVLRSVLGHVPNKTPDNIRDSRNRVDSNYMNSPMSIVYSRTLSGSGDDGRGMFARSTSGRMGNWQGLQSVRP
jgi:hypothetical protein